MEPETVSHDQLEAVLHRLLPATIPALLVAIGYVDPGKWVATVEGGARFGADLIILVLIFNLTAVLCQYLSARIGVVTGRDLAQICSEEYDKVTCVLLGVQTEISVIALDLTMTLGVAHALNLLFGLDLSTCVFLAAIDAFLFPIFTSVLENHMARLLSLCLVGLILVSYLLGVLVSQPEIPLPYTGMLTKFNGDSAFALMGLLGANIMPHNFYLHSSIIWQRQGSSTVSKSLLCHDHLFAISCIFSGLFLVNYVLLNSSATFFFSGDSTGLILLTFQDAISLLEQVFRSPVAPLAFFLVLFFANQIKAQTWSVGGQFVLHDFLKLDIPSWLHHTTIRIIAMAPALYCVWTSGAEGIYQLLIFTQVMTAMLLPSSVIPLFRVASSRPIMGVYKNSQVVDFLALGTFMGMLGINLMFLAEMIFGQSDWVGNLRWNSGSSMSAAYVVLLIIACWSFCLTLWLAATPLKSASSADAVIWGWESQNAAAEPPMINTEANDFSKTRYNREEPIHEHEEKQVKSSMERDAKFDLDLSEKLPVSGQDFKLTSVEENICVSRFPDQPVQHYKDDSYKDDSLSSKQPVSTPPIVNEVPDNDIPETMTVKSDSMEPIEKVMTSPKEDVDMDVWEPEEPSRSIPESTPSFPSDGPSSFRSLSGKLDETGNGPGSSRLAGLGRAARRSLASVLDEFWGQLYDLHGQAILEGNAKKQGTEPKSVSSSSLKVDTSVKELGGYPMNNSTLYDSPRRQQQQQQQQQQRVISRPNHMQSMDAGERRYSSLRAPPSSEGWDYQPATIHGYQLASYVNRMANDRNSEYLNNTQMESPAPKSPSLGPAIYRDSLAIALGQNLQNGISPAQASVYQSFAMSRNSSLQSERLNNYNNIVPVSSELIDGGGAKKYHSLPDISGLLPQRGLSMNSQWDGSAGYGSSINMSSMGGLRNTGASPLSSFEEHPATKAYRSTLPMGGSLWSRQPFEQFGVSDNGNGQQKSSSVTEEAVVPTVDPEAKLLQSFRLCIVKLLKLEGSDWLFKQNDGVDEDLIERVAAREKFLYEAETRELNHVAQVDEQQYMSSQRNFGSVGQTNNNDEASISSCSSVPHCGEGCIWKADLVISFGVWCIHRILDLSVMESRPELWGKYTYVLNRLQGVIDPAFSKPRSPSPPCFCVQIPASYQPRTSLPPPITNGSLLPPAKPPSRGKCTTAAGLLDIVKDVEIAISCRKGRTGTAAGDVAFPKGKENLASVLKRYKRRLAIKPAGIHDASGTRKVQPPPGFGL